MDAGEVLALGLGVMPPWRLVSQHLETGKSPHELHLFLEADRGSLLPARNALEPAQRMILTNFAGGI